MKWKVDKMATERQNGKLTKWKVVESAIWYSVKLTKCQVDEMAN
jgi:hypothetical protein